jgi:hypothetical protein
MLRAVFLGIDLGNFYLNTPLPNYEYMQLRLDIIPEEIMLAYNLCDIVALMDGSTSRSGKGCTVSPRPAFWQTSCWNNVYPPGDIINANTCQDCGGTCGGPSLFALSLTTLAYE